MRPSDARPLNGDQGTAHFLGEKGFVKDFRLVEGNQLVVGAVKMEKWRVIGAYVSEGEACRAFSLAF